MKKLTYCFLSVFFGIILHATPSMASMYDISKFWTHLTNPVSYLKLEEKNIAPGAFSFYNLNEDLDGITDTSAAMASPHHTIAKDAETMEETYRERMSDPNFFVWLITLGNEKSIINLNLAMIAGENFVPYSIFSYSHSSFFDNISQKNNTTNKQEHNWYYIARNLDAPSVLLYGYSWFINLPAKFLAELNVLAYDEPDNFPFSWLVVIDILVNILALLVEIPIAFFNTIIGAIIALLFHPWDSICSFLGMFYYGISTTITAIWECFANLISIPYNLLFDWK